MNRRLWLTASVLLLLALSVTLVLRLPSGTSSDGHPATEKKTTNAGQPTAYEALEEQPAAAVPTTAGDRYESALHYTENVLLPRLYASGELDAWLTAMLLPRVSDSSYPAWSFMELALAHSPGDPLVLAAATRFCHYNRMSIRTVEPYTDWQLDAVEQCGQHDFLARLFDVAPGNAYNWLLQAAVSDDPTPHLEKAAGSPYYTPYIDEFETVAAQVISVHAAEYPDQNTLVLLGKTASQAYYRAAIEVCIHPTPETQMSCQSLVTLFADSGTVVDWLAANTVALNTGVALQSDAGFSLDDLMSLNETWATQVDTVSQIYNQYRLDHSEIEAYRKTMTHLGIISPVSEN